MTYEEAIVHIKRHLYHQKMNSDSQMYVGAALNMAIKACEKQVPKKPDYEGDGYGDNGELVYDIAYCPVCNHCFEYGINDWGNEHCECGQALDWSTEEEE